MISVSGYCIFVFKICQTVACISVIRHFHDFFKSKFLAGFWQLGPTVGGRAIQLERKSSIMYGMCAAVTKYFFPERTAAFLLSLTASASVERSSFLTMCKDTSSVRYAKQLESASYMRVFSIIIKLHFSNCPKLAAVWREVSSKVEWSLFLIMCKDTSSMRYVKQLESTSYMR